jgi:hypothetical protein
MPAKKKKVAINPSLIQCKMLCGRWMKEFVGSSKLIREKYFSAKGVLERVNEMNVHNNKRIPTERLSFIKARKGLIILLRILNSCYVSFK